MQYYLNHLMGIRSRNQLYVSALQPLEPYELTAGEAAGTAMVTAEDMAREVRVVREAADRADMVTIERALSSAGTRAFLVAITTILVAEIAEREGLNSGDARRAAEDLERHRVYINSILSVIAELSPEETTREVQQLAMTAADAAREARQLANRIEAARMAIEPNDIFLL